MHYIEFLFTKPVALNYRILLCSLLVASTLTVGAQSAKFRDTAAILKAVPMIPAIGPGDTRVQFPTPPNGYTLQLLGSDHRPVIDSTGGLHTPLMDMKVRLLFALVAKDDPQFKLEVPKAVLVPGATGHQLVNANPAPFVIPQLKEWKGSTGHFQLSTQSRIIIDLANKEALEKIAHQLQGEMKATTHFNLPIQVGKPKKGDIYLQLSTKHPALGKEGYLMAIGSSLDITAKDDQGLFWGTRTLLQLLEQNKEIPRGLARDYPTYAVRSFILDVGRKFFTMDFLRSYVKLLSYYKFNDFQIHLNDNAFKKYFDNNWDSTYSAFRLENDRFPGLTAKDGHYSKEAFRELQHLGNQYGVQIVPEIDVPAHALSITKAVPQIASEKYGHDHLDLSNPLTDSVVQAIFREYLEGPNPVFINPVVDIGTDEYAKEAAEQFRGFTDRLINFVQTYHKQVRLWGALTWAKGETPVRVKGVTMNAWYNGYADPIEMKKLGYPLISTPDGWLYIVPAAGYYYDYLNLANLYHKWTPSLVGDVPFHPGDPTISGGAFAVWNDIVGNGISMKDVNDRVFPALQVLSQKMWSAADTLISFSAFNKRRRGIGEGPGLNMRGLLRQRFPGVDSLVLGSGPLNRADLKLHHAKWGGKTPGGNHPTPKTALSFLGENSYVELPIDEIGYDYTVSFYVKAAGLGKDSDKLSEASPITPFSKSDNAQFFLRQKETGNLGFSKEGYDYSFNYRLPVSKWTHIVITGTHKGTELYVNGDLQDRLYDHWLTSDSSVRSKADKFKVRKVETLFFPLQKIGGFKGAVKNLQIWNRVLPPDKIKQL